MTVVVLFDGQGGVVVFGDLAVTYLLYTWADRPGSSMY